MDLGKIVGLGYGSTFLHGNAGDMDKLFKDGLHKRTGVEDIDVLDSDWLRSRFMVPGEDITDGIARDNRFMSTAYWKYTNSEVGGNIGINPKPQYTRYADVRYPQNVRRNTNDEISVTNVSNKQPMGRYYSEAIDDNEQVIFMEFGIPRFNSLIDYFTHAIDYRASVIATQGRSPRWYNFGKAAGNVAVFVAFPWTSLLIWGAKWVGTALGVIGGSMFRYYYLDPAMHMYWGMVNNIVTNMATELGLLAVNADKSSSGGSSGNAALDKLTGLLNTASSISGKVSSFIGGKGKGGGQQSVTKEKVGMRLTFNTEDRAGLAQYFGDLINNNGFIDVYAIASKSSAIYNRLAEAQQDVGDDGGNIVSRFGGALTGVLSAFSSSRGGTGGGAGDYAKDYESYRQKVYASVGGASGGGAGSALGSIGGLISKLHSTVTNIATGRSSSIFNGGLSGAKSAVASSIDSSSVARTYADFLALTVGASGAIWNNGDETTAPTEANSNTNTKQNIFKQADGDDHKSSEAISGLQTASEDEAKALSADENGLISVIGNLFKSSQDYFQKLANYGGLATRSGGRFATFYVDYTGSVSDSFSNSTGPIGTETGAKSITSAATNLRFELGGDNVLGRVQADAVGAIKDVLAGTLDSITFGLGGIIQTILGGAYLDMPDKWEDSQSDIGSTSYSMTLISPYGNPISQMINIYIPLAMLLAGVLPQGTGKGSYASPLLCSVYDRGVQNIRLGIIQSLSISRGTSNLPWTKDKRPLAIEINFTVKNLSNIMTTPIISSIFDTFKVVFEDDAPISDYVATVCGRDHLTSKYKFPKVKLKLSRMMFAFDQATSPAAWGLRMGMGVDKLLGNFLSDRQATQAIKSGTTGYF
jgi:hypothetical protein|nr:MAG TPA: hypothetical protein [Caudoviricetes sp.]